MVDTGDLKSPDRMVVLVRVQSWVPPQALVGMSCFYQKATVITQEFLETAEDVFAFVRARQAAGEGCCLGVITDVSGGSARACGTVFAVTAQGHMAGYVSNGCVDADVVAQAQQALQQGTPRSLIYGAGSPFMDLQLPCGGTVKLLLDPAPAADTCADIAAALTDRQPVTARFDAQNGLTGGAQGTSRTGWTDGVFSACHIPRLHIITAGIGAPIFALARAASALSIPTIIASPDTHDAGAALAAGAKRHVALISPDTPVDLAPDRYTAMLLMFHAHDWEPLILARALGSDAFYIGALGSARTQGNRLETLADMGLSPIDIARVHGPIGVLPSARDSGTLAISTLAEIIGAYRALTPR